MSKPTRNPRTIPTHPGAMTPEQLTRRRLSRLIYWATAGAVETAIFVAVLAWYIATH